MLPVGTHVPVAIGTPPVARSTTVIGAALVVASLASPETGAPVDAVDNGGGEGEEAARATSGREGDGATAPAGDDAGWWIVVGIVVPGRPRAGA